MNKYKFINLFYALVMMVVIISISTCAILFTKQLYYFDIQYLDVQEDLDWGVERIKRNYNYLVENKGIDEDKYQSLINNQPMSKEMLKENYDILIDYNSVFNHGELDFPNFPMSDSGIKHFKEVKVVFGITEYIAIIGGILGLALSIKKYKDQDFIYFKMVSIVTFIVPMVLGLIGAINFDRLFTVFHQVVFRNDDWIFDFMIDPIILILPEDFFMHCFIGIIAIVWAICLIYYVIGKKLEKKWLKVI